MNTIRFSLLIFFLLLMPSVSEISAQTVTHEWAKRIGGVGLDHVVDLSTNANADVHVVGFINGDADLNGNGTTTDGGAEDGTGYAGRDGFLSVFDSTGTYQWSKRFGGIGSDVANGVVIDTSERVIVSGRAEGNADLNGNGTTTDGGAEDGAGYGSYDGFLSVFDSAGAHEWSRRIGGSGVDVAYSVIHDSNNNLYITGLIQGDADLNGNGTTTDGGAEDGTGYGSYDVFISSFDSAGAHRWSKRLGGASDDRGYSIVSDSLDNVYVAGIITGDADLNGNGTTTDGGAEDGTGYGGSDYFVSKFNSSGTHQWSKRLGGAANDSTGFTLIQLTIDENDNLAVPFSVQGDADLNGNGTTTDGGAEDGTGYGSYDIALSVFSAEGDYLWSKRLGGTAWEFGISAATDADGRISITGSVDNIPSDLSGDGDADDGGGEGVGVYGGWSTFSSTFESNGNYLWSNRFGGTSTDLGYSVAYSTNGDLVLAGRTHGIVDADLNADGDFDDQAEEAIYDDDDGFLTVFSVLYDSTAPALTLNTLTPGTDTEPILTGTAADADGTVASVEFQLATTTGSWTACTADDATFDEASEAFSCTLGTLSQGTTYTVYTRATDDSANTTTGGSEVSQTLSIDSSTTYGSRSSRAQTVTPIEINVPEDTPPTIESLTERLNELRAQLAELLGTPAPNPESEGGGGNSAHTYLTDITLGSTHPDVPKLQQYLVQRGYLTMPEGVSYGYFGPLTQAALAQFQEANNIKPPQGYFGPITRAFLNQ